MKTHSRILVSGVILFGFAACAESSGDNQVVAGPPESNAAETTPASNAEDPAGDSDSNDSLTDGLRVGDPVSPVNPPWITDSGDMIEDLAPELISVCDSNDGCRVIAGFITRDDFFAEPPPPPPPPGTPEYDPTLTFEEPTFVLYDEHRNAIGTLRGSEIRLEGG